MAKFDLNAAIVAENPGKDPTWSGWQKAADRIQAKQNLKESGAVKTNPKLNQTIQTSKNKNQTRDTEDSKKKTGLSKYDSILNDFENGNINKSIYSSSF